MTKERAKVCARWLSRQRKSANGRGATLAAVVQFQKLRSLGGNGDSLKFLKDRIAAGDLKVRPDLYDDVVEGAAAASIYAVPIVEGAGGKFLETLGLVSIDQYFVFGGSIRQGANDSEAS